MYAGKIAAKKPVAQGTNDKPSLAGRIDMGLPSLHLEVFAAGGITNLAGEGRIASIRGAVELTGDADDIPIQTPHHSMRVVRMACVAYWLLLSVLLLVPDPYALLGIDRSHGLSGDRLVHFAFFTTLALLVHVARLPVGRVLLWSTIVVYAVAVELLQSLVPHRVVDVVDLAENLLGLVAGTGIWFFVRRIPVVRGMVGQNACCSEPLGDGKDRLAKRHPTDA